MGKPGLVINSSLQVACGTSSIKIVEIQRPGKKIQKTKEFLLGFPISNNTQLD
jgi:methionyl-tRNA formyltransferase